MREGTLAAGAVTLVRKWNAHLSAGRASIGSVTDRRQSIQRVKIPNPSLDLIEEEGGQHGWVWAIPLPYRAVAARWSGSAMPAAPRNVLEDEGHFEHQIGYYAALQSFLMYSFGWTRPDKGLLWWYREGQPIDDARFELISDVWERDGNLIGFLSWLASAGPNLADRTLLPWTKHPDASPLKLDPNWELRLRRAQDVAPWTGGSDPFHLGGGVQVSAPSRWDDVSGENAGRSLSDTVRLLGVDATARTATFVSDTIRGWYLGLATLGDRLPPLKGQRNWHIDVFVKPIGFLGTYRRSRDTGLWFAGAHRYHIVGN